MENCLFLKDHQPRLVAFSKIYILRYCSTNRQCFISLLPLDLACPWSKLSLQIFATFNLISFPGICFPHPHCLREHLCGHRHPGHFLFPCHHSLTLPLCLWRKFCPAPGMKREFHQCCRKMHYLKQPTETATALWVFSFVLFSTSNQVCSPYSADSEGALILITGKGI